MTKLRSRSIATFCTCVVLLSALRLFRAKSANDASCQRTVGHNVTQIEPVIVSPSPLNTYKSPCENAALPTTGKKTRAHVSGVDFNIFVYDHVSVRDIVSGSIKSSGAWEKGDTERIMKILSRNSVGVLLDIGANLGWFTMVGLHLGHKVISFEPFISNVQMMCASVRELQDTLNFRLYNLGLDIRARTCELFQKKTQNIGDTHSICDPASREQFIQKGYAPLGWMNTTTLDSALESGLFDSVDHIDVMKVDVEGFEHAVVDGGNQFFHSDLAPKYVYMELVSSLMGDAGGLKDRGAHRLAGVLLRLANYGYELDKSSRSPDTFLQTSPLEAVIRAVDGKTVMFVHQSVAGSR